ncbi:MAG: tail fiber protein [Saprospiraceae bacterium]
MEPFLGQIQPFGFNFAARGWAFCDGQLMSIAANTALFSLLGTMYGGDGRTTFALPDLRSRSIVHIGTGPGLSHITQGQKGGWENVTLTTANLPSHNHAVRATTDDGTLDEPANGVRFGTAGTTVYAANGSSTIVMAGDTTTSVGGSQAFNIRNPFLGIPYSIALQGIFPSRN